MLRLIQIVESFTHPIEIISTLELRKLRFGDVTFVQVIDLGFKCMFVPCQCRCS